MTAATAVPLVAPAHAQAPTHRCTYTYQGQTYHYVAALAENDVRYLATVGVVCVPGTA